MLSLGPAITPPPPPPQKKENSFPFSTLYSVSSKIEDAIMSKLCWVEVIRKCDCSSSTAKRKGFSVFATRFKVNVVLRRSWWEGAVETFNAIFQLILYNA
jgi:hypothetical protein